MASSQDEIFYRPQIQLDCRMVRKLVEEGAFTESPLVVADVGVREGFDRSWDIFADQCLQVGFEPDLEECARIKAEYVKRTSQHLPRECIENIALWDQVGTRTLYITRDAAATSCFPPNEAFIRRLPDQSQVEVVDTVDISTITLDYYHKKEGINFDVLKLDVQGGELPILKGAIGQLGSSILAVITEVGFVELYLGQPFFADVDQFLRAQGFALFDLDIRRWRREPLPDTFNGIRVGQAVWADALYLKDPVEHGAPVGDGDVKRLKLMKLAALAEHFSLPDYAMEILSLARSLSLIEKSEEDRLVALLKDNHIIARRSRTEPHLGSR